MAANGYTRREHKSAPLPSYGSEMKQGERTKAGPTGDMPSIQKATRQGGQNVTSPSSGIPSIQSILRQSNGKK